jgi:hypothetical protein
VAFDFAGGSTILSENPPTFHIVPLAKGGADKAFNMQLIPKDSVEERSELK